MEETTLETLLRELPRENRRINEIVDLTKWDYKKEIALITLGCGYGKTFTSFNLTDGFLKLVNDRINLGCFPGIDEFQEIRPEETIFITPRASIKEENVADYWESCYQIKTEFDLLESNIDSIGKIGIICYQTLGKILRDNPRLLDNVRLLICDEYHMLYTDATFASQSFEVRKWIEERVGDMAVIGLTATPLPYWNIKGQEKEVRMREEYVEQFNVPHVIVNDEVENKHSAENVIILNGSVIDTYEKMYETPHEKMLVCLQSAKQCYDQYYKHEDSSWVVCGKNNKKTYPATGKTYAEMFDEVRFNKLKYNKTVDFGIEKLYITSFLEVGFNIKDETFQTIICESFMPHQIQQYRGRIRSDIKNLVIIAPRFFRTVDRENSTPDRICFTENGSFDKTVNQCLGFLSLLDGKSEIERQAIMEQRYMLQLEEEDSETLYPHIPIVGRWNGKYEVDWAIVQYLMYEEQCYMSAFFGWDCKEYFYGDVAIPNKQEFYSNLVAPLSKKKPVFRKVSDAEKKEIRNKDRIESFDWEPWLNRNLDSASRKELMSQLRITNNKKEIYKTMNKQVIEILGMFKINVRKKKIKGYEYYILQRV